MTLVVDIHLRRAKKANEALAGGFGEADGERRGGGDAGDERQSGGNRFLHELEGDTAGDEEEAF